MPPEIPIRICSHKRSGTHLLGATIWKNFELPDVSSSVRMPSGYKFVRGDEVWGPGSRAIIPWHHLWHTHNLWARDPKRTLYIVRHPIDTLMSFWRLLDPLCKRDSDLFVGKQGVANWLRHVEWYTRGCHWVRYEDLISDKHDQVLDQIASWYSLTKADSYYKRVQERVGWASYETPIQPKEPPEKLLRAIDEILPDTLLGYSLTYDKLTNYKVTEDIHVEEMNSEKIRHLYDETYFLGGISKFNGQEIGVEGLKEFRENSISQQKLSLIKMVEVEGKVVLDVGFGRGEALKWCKKQGAKKCIGIDYAPAAKEIASKHIDDSSVPLYTLSVTEIDRIPEKDIDIVFLMDILEHVSTKEWDEFLDKLMPKLSQDHVLVSSTPASPIGDYMNMHNNYFTEKRLHDLLDSYFSSVEITKGSKFVIKCT